MKRLRSFAAGLVVPLFLAFTAGAVVAQGSGHLPSTTEFTMNAEVFDGGQQIVSLTLDTQGYGVQRSSLDADTFSVHATGTNPYPAELVFGTFDADRTVTDVHLDPAGRIVIDLEHGFGITAANTFGYGLFIGRNVVFDLEYTVTQNEPIKARGDSSFMFSSLVQGEVADPEVDAFSTGESNGLNYRLYTPARSSERPLIVWLHGGGEGGWAEVQDNELPLIANRGALGFATREAQKIFGGAYVLVPQATDFWLNDPVMGYSAQLKAVIDDFVATHPVDTDKIYVVGASNGGYMTAQLTADYPDFFAADVPICPARLAFGTTMLTDDELLAMGSTPTWIVQAENDNVLPFVDNGLYMSEHIPGAILSAYPDVTWDGVTYQGHWSWIYVARNDPINDSGQHIWQWMAQQSNDL